MRKRIITIVLLCLVLLLTSCGTQNSTQTGMTRSVDAQEHFMVNGTIYWASSFPSGMMPNSFQFAGEIKEAVGKTPTCDWQSYTLPVGTKVYLNPELPYQAWVDGTHRYVTLEAGRQYILYRNELFVYLGSVHGYDSEYYAEYRDAWSIRVNYKGLPHESVYVGETTFEGYDKYPVLELGSNAYEISCSVYQYTEDENVLFAATDEIASVYVKVP